MKKRAGVLLIALAALAGLLAIPISPAQPQLAPSAHAEVQTMDLSAYSTKPLEHTKRLLFIHHSCGGQLLADPGPSVGESCIYETHPNAGGLRKRLVSNGYEVHEASYDSEVGDRTDIFDWLPKFRDKMDRVLRVDQQDLLYEDDRRNHLVLFKSCFPNNEFTGRGLPPGSPDGPELTVWNAKAAYQALLPEFEKHLDVLFVAVTAPPLAASRPQERLWKRIARIVLHKPLPSLANSGALAREFNNWLRARDGWLADYSERNVAVFDYYDILTGAGRSDFSMYPTGDNGHDSHPNAEGNHLAAEALLPFLNAAVRRAFDPRRSSFARPTSGIQLPH